MTSTSVLIAVFGLLALVSWLLLHNRMLRLGVMAVAVAGIVASLLCGPLNAYWHAATEMYAAFDHSHQAATEPPKQVSASPAPAATQVASPAQAAAPAPAPAQVAAAPSAPVVPVPASGDIIVPPTANQNLGPVDDGKGKSVAALSQPEPKSAPKAPAPKAAPKSEVAHKPERVWAHFGAAPFAPDMDMACKKLPQAVDGSSLPQEVKDHFKQVSGTNCTGGTVSWYTPGTHFEQMWSGPDRTHKSDWIMNNGAVGLIPVTESPEGRRYRPGSVAETVRVLEWRYEYNGQTYVWFVAYTCGNSGWLYGEGRQMAGPSHCREIALNGPVGGSVRWGVGSASGPLPASVCNAQKQGDGPWTAWMSECDWCKPSLSFIQNLLGAIATIPHKYKYEVMAVRQVLRFDVSIDTRVVYFCLETAARAESCGIYVRPQDWKDANGQPIYRIEIPDSAIHYGFNCKQ